MAVSLKGGHNAEPHNHNDKGTFVVAVGNESLILDPGGEVYTARTFSKDRYKSNLLNSFGHPVPVVAGKLQRPGRDAKAVIVSHKFTEAADTLAMDLRSAYGVKELKTLRRTFVYTRTGEGSLTVSDDFVFSTPQTFGSALITYGRWKKLSEHELLISAGREAVKVSIATQGVPFDVVAETIQEENHGKSQPTRIGINLINPQANGRVVFTIVPSSRTSNYSLVLHIAFIFLCSTSQRLILKLSRPSSRPTSRPLFCATQTQPRQPLLESLLRPFLSVGFRELPFQLKQEQTELLHRLAPPARRNAWLRAC